MEKFFASQINALLSDMQRNDVPAIKGHIAFFSSWGGALGAAALVAQKHLDLVDPQPKKPTTVEPDQPWAPPPIT